MGFERLSLIADPVFKKEVQARMDWSLSTGRILPVSRVVYNVFSDIQDDRKSLWRLPLGLRSPLLPCRIFDKSRASVATMDANSGLVSAFLASINLAGFFANKPSVQNGMLTICPLGD